MRLGRVAAAAAAVSALAAGAPSAVAQQTASVIYITKAYQTTMGNDRSAIAAVCAVDATGANAAQVSACFLRGADGSRYDLADHGSLPGTTNARVGATLNVPEQAYSICVQARVLMDSGYYETAVSCSPVDRIT